MSEKFMFELLKFNGGKATVEAFNGSDREIGLYMHRKRYKAKKEDTKPKPYALYEVLQQSYLILEF